MSGDGPGRAEVVLCSTRNCQNTKHTGQAQRHSGPSTQLPHPSPKHTTGCINGDMEGWTMDSTLKRCPSSAFIWRYSMQYVNKKKLCFRTLYSVYSFSIACSPWSSKVHTRGTLLIKSCETSTRASTMKRIRSTHRCQSIIHGYQLLHGYTKLAISSQTVFSLRNKDSIYQEASVLSWPRSPRILPQNVVWACQYRNSPKRCTAKQPVTV